MSALALSLHLHHAVPLPPTSTLFPYTTLFRSAHSGGAGNKDNAPTTEQNDPSFHVPTNGRSSYANSCSVVPSSLNGDTRSEEHTSELQSLRHLVCRLLLEKKNK